VTIEEEKLETVVTNRKVGDQGSEAKASAARDHHFLFLLVFHRKGEEESRKFKCHWLPVIPTIFVPPWAMITTRRITPRPVASRDVFKKPSVSSTDPVLYIDFRLSGN
jgi:hypothetical protein